MDGTKLAYFATTSVTKKNKVLKHWQLTSNNLDGLGVETKWFN
jgi:hypothetical protein